MNCWQGPHFQSTFGHHTQEDILHLFGGLKTLFLMHVNLPAIFFEKLPPLRFLCLAGVHLASATDVALTPLSAFHPNAEIKADYASLQEVHRLFRRSQQPLPGYTILQINDIIRGLRNVLEGSQNTLTRLELQITYNCPPEDRYFDFGHYERLTSLHIRMNHYDDVWDISRIFKCIHLYFIAAAELCNPPTSMSHLVNIEISLFCSSTMQFSDVDLDKADDTVSTLVEGLGRLASSNITAHHPKLDSVKLNITLPTASSVDVERETINNYRNFVERCIKEAVEVDNQTLTYAVQVD
ncbi:hypothetical protein CPB83DRAFT_862913 [Crepidotus variabilis]|uniref:Uncharacterized protein n=1 Tax=Crepidotus variabilis TaxID=179855 RepID=A0A9P6E6H7_9AGAR|nr:hypothetical protein CPB83DRAFT_862913 [Crepidotus variabilis]